MSAEDLERIYAEIEATQLEIEQLKTTENNLRDQLRLLEISLQDMRDQHDRLEARHRMTTFQVELEDQPPEAPSRVERKR